MKQDYELMLVLNPALSQEESAEARDRVRELVTKDGGEILVEDEWGTRRLAYSIRKIGQTYLEGDYSVTYFNSDSSVLKELEGYLRLSERVLRHMVVIGSPPKKVDPPKIVEPGALAETEEPAAVADVTASEKAEEPEAPAEIEEPAAVADVTESKEPRSNGG